MRAGSLPMLLLVLREHAGSRLGIVTLGPGCLRAACLGTCGSSWLQLALAPVLAPTFALLPPSTAAAAAAAPAPAAAASAPPPPLFLNASCAMVAMSLGGMVWHLNWVRKEEALGLSSASTSGNNIGLSVMCARSKSGCVKMGALSEAPVLNPALTRHPATSYRGVTKCLVIQSVWGWPKEGHFLSASPLIWGWPPGQRQW